MPNEKHTPEEESQKPYDPESGALKEAKWVEDEEKFLEAVGATDAEADRKKLEKLDDDYYNNAQQEQWEEDARRSDVLKQRLANGGISPKYNWMFEKDGNDAVAFANRFQDLVSEAMKDQTWDHNDYRSYMRYVDLEQQAEVELMKDIFPAFAVFLQGELTKAKELGSTELEANIVSSAVQRFLDGEDLPRPEPRKATAKGASEAVAGVEIEVNKADVAQAHVFRAVLDLERSKELVSGMMYRPSTEGVLTAYRQLFADTGGLMTDEQVAEVRTHLESVFNAILGFAEDKLKRRYTTSYIQNVSLLDKAPNELCRFRDPTGSRDVPYASVFYVDGNLEYRLAEKDGFSKAINQHDKSEEVQTGTIGEYRLSETTLQALDQYMHSDKFRENWDAQQAKLSFTPKHSVEKI